MERQKKVKNYTDYICMEKSRNQINYFLFSNNARYLNQWGCVIYLDYAIFELIKKFQFTVLNIEVILLHYIATSIGNAVRLPKMKISLAQFYWKYTTNSLVKMNGSLLSILEVIFLLVALYVKHLWLLMVTAAFLSFAFIFKMIKMTCFLGSIANLKVLIS